jgi:hypothetical protein
MVHWAEQTPASFSPLRARRDGFNAGFRATVRDSVTDPDTVLSVALVPRLRRSALRATRVSLTPTPPAPAPFEPEPSRTGRPPRRRSRRAAARGEAVRAVVREHVPSHDVSAVIRSAEASATDSSVEKTAKSGGAGLPASKLTAPLRPVFPAASAWRARAV